MGDSARFDRCSQLWLHALTLRQNTNLPVTKDLLRFAQVFSQMIKVGLEVDVTIVHKVLSATVLEIERNQTRIANPGLKDDPEALQEEMENNCLTSLYLVMILTKVCKFPCASTSKLLLQAGADPQATDQTKNTPLHVIVSYKKIVSDFLTLHAIIMALLEAGAHIDAVNAAGQTPLSAAATGVAEIILKSQS